MAADPLLAAVVIIAGLGVGAQVLASRLRVPSVLFLVLAGVAVGPEGIGIVRPAAFGAGLSTVVGLSVGIIVFEGAFHLKLDRVRAAPREALRLVTVGAAISLVGTAVAVHYLLGAEWDVAVLVGALLVATGPTVITPIMNVVPVRERVAAALEVEGIVNDVTAAIVAVATFELVLAPAGGFGVVLEAFTARLGLGVLVGAAVGVAIYVLLQHTDLSRENAPRDARLIVLVGALVAYGAAESVLSEAGIAAAAIGGVVLGNLHPPYEDVITEFKGDVTLLVLSFVFITLAALLSVSDLVGLGLGGLAVVAIVVFVLRPLGVLLSTVGDRFTARERAFIGAIGPRGIVPASVATLFAIELQPTNPTGASVLVGTVFLVILVTVVFQGGLARHIAQALAVIPKRVIVVGAGRVGRGLGTRLADRGEEVALIDVDEAVVEDARAQGFRVIVGDATEATVLERAGIENASVVAAATGADDVNLLVAQLATTRYGVETVIARVNHPENRDAFDELDVRTISAGEAVAASMDNAIERPTITHWMTDVDRTGDVQEVELRAREFDGATVDELVEALPGEYVVPVVARDGRTHVPGGSFRLRLGDSITIIGEDRSAVHRAMELCRGE